jgi:hypothetical protein
MRLLTAAVLTLALTGQAGAQQGGIGDPIIKPSLIYVSAPYPAIYTEAGTIEVDLQIGPESCSYSVENDWVYVYAVGAIDGITYTASVQIGDVTAFPFSFMLTIQGNNGQPLPVQEYNVWAVFQWWDGTTWNTQTLPTVDAEGWDQGI